MEISLALDKDGKHGEDNPVTSMLVILDWWTTSRKYNKYRGKENNRLSKRAICANFSDINKCGFWGSMHCKQSHVQDELY